MSERFARVLARVSYAPWQINLGHDGPRAYLQVADAKGRCNITGEPAPWTGRKWFLSPHMTDTEIVKTALNAVLAAVTHEALETFRYDGVTIFDPHISVDDLLALRLSRPLDHRADPL